MLLRKCDTNSARLAIAFVLAVAMPGGEIYTAEEGAGVGGQKGLERARPLWNALESGRG
jgi:hypothetical protein